ncbi:MAG: gamma-glutamyltranspeptidase / glutathione hydrolase [Gammaproteobacteria bacterium]|jgi:gamma-glutamyltranspeptidase/glutathione hydrolase|nr:gamma-glutamyltranspeptidase / glutathione hydrolase [Gammaproteobacteria bacterium]
MAAATLLTLAGIPFSYSAADVGSPDPGHPAAAGFSAVRGDRTSGWLSQTRSEVLARNGVVATSQPLAAQAGLQILKSGGNAFDAAVATAAVLNLVEPGSAGMGGDVFVLAWVAKEKKLIALNASGRSPTGATPSRMAERGFTKQMPVHGIDSATVPGAVDGWDALLKRAGTMTFKQTLEPAAVLAEQGFGVTERIRNDWIYGADVLKDDPDSVKTYLVNGKLPDNYAIFRNPDLAKAFRVLESQGRDAFYKGEIARAIVAKSKSLGGTMTMEDLAATHATWETPISTNYHGYDIYEMPPNTQGFAVLEMMNILEVCAPRLGMNLAALGPRSPAYWHMLVEAKKLAYADLYAFNADPGFSRIPVEKLLSKSHAAELCGRIDPKKARTPEPMGDPAGGTVYLAAADRWGNMVSFIYSVYDTFGSGVTVPGYGFVLNDRGALFSLNPKSPNVIAPHKRPFHTLIPGFLMKDGKPVMAFGLMGGSMQAQGHAQVLVDMIDLGANPQAATDAARFSHSQESNTLSLESNLYDLVGAKLQAMGHKVESTNGEDMGGYQSIWFVPEVTGVGANAAAHKGPPASSAAEQPVAGVYRAASDHRKDGQAVGW